VRLRPLVERGSLVGTTPFASVLSRASATGFDGGLIAY
jgi:hypothetical protein